MEKKVDQLEEQARRMEAEKSSAEDAKKLCEEIQCLKQKNVSLQEMYRTVEEENNVRLATSFLVLLLVIVLCRTIRNSYF